MKITKQRLKEIIKEELSTFEEAFDADWQNEEDKEEAHRAGEADGAAGRASTPPHGAAADVYKKAYSNAFNRTAGARVVKSRQGLKRRASDLARQKKLVKRTSPNQMKITKQRLKEIIKAELTAEGSREDMMMPALSQADFDAAMATDEPRHEGGTPMERLLNKLLIVSNIGVGEGGAAAARKLGLGDDEEVIAYLDDLLGNQMYKESGLEEAAPWDKEALKRSYPGDGNAHAVIDREHDYGTERHKVVDKLRRVGGDPSKSPYGSSR